MYIKENLIALLNSLPPNVQVVATSKTHPTDSIMEAYSVGHRIFGENKVQELLVKYNSLPKDIEWHFIGHLQTNKIKQIVPFVSLIHGVDSLKVLDEINKQALKCDRIVDCLLQVHIAKEETKFGFSVDEVSQFFLSHAYNQYPGIRIRGLMGMATNSDDLDLVNEEFASINELYKQCREIFGDSKFSILSIGMSGDYNIAIQHGGNLLRIGTMIFGDRDYGHNL